LGWRGSSALWPSAVWPAPAHLLVGLSAWAVGAVLGVSLAWLAGAAGRVRLGMLQLCWCAPRLRLWGWFLCAVLLSCSVCPFFNLLLRYREQVPGQWDCGNAIPSKKKKLFEIAAQISL